MGTGRLSRIMKQRREREALRIELGKPVPEKLYATRYPDLLWEAYDKIMRELQ